MKRLFVAVAIVSLAATGCVSSTQLARNNAAAAQVARAKPAAQPEIVQTAYLEGGLLAGFNHKVKNCCDPSCGNCCETECGCAECPCDECCDATCGCPTQCCDPCCGCEDPCCGSCCDNRSFLQKCVDRIAGGGCSNGKNGCGGCNGMNGCNCGLGHCQGGRGSGGSVCGGGTGGHCGCGPCCATCAAHECCLCPHAGGYPAMTRFNPGPPVGQVAYPYYTTRGPRDFLQDNPPTIGPY